MAVTVAEVAEVKRSTLRTWQQFGWLKTEIPKEGREWTLYSYIDLCVVRAASVMIRQGISGNIAVPIAEMLRPFFGSDDGAQVPFVSIHYAPHTEKGAIPPEKVRVVQRPAEQPIIGLWPESDAEGEAVIVLNLFNIENGVLKVVADPETPTVATKEETMRIVAQAFAEALEPPPDDSEPHQK